MDRDKHLHDREEHTQQFVFICSQPRPISRWVHPTNSVLTGHLDNPIWLHHCMVLVYIYTLSVFSEDDDEVWESTISVSEYAVLVLILPHKTVDRGSCRGRQKNQMQRKVQRIAPGNSTMGHESMIYALFWGETVSSLVSFCDGTKNATMEHLWYQQHTSLGTDSNFWTSFGFSRCTWCFVDKPGMWIWDQRRTHDGAYAWGLHSNMSGRLWESEATSEPLLVFSDSLVVLLTSL